MQAHQRIANRLLVSGIILIVIGVFVATSLSSVLAWLQLTVSQDAMTLTWAIFSSLGSSIAPMGGVLIGASVVLKVIKIESKSIDGRFEGT